MNKNWDSGFSEKVIKENCIEIENQTLVQKQVTPMKNMLQLSPTVDVQSSERGDGRGIALGPLTTSKFDSEDNRGQIGKKGGVSTGLADMYK